MNILEVETDDYIYRLYRSVYPPVESNMYVLVEGNEAIVVDSNITDEVLDSLKKHGVEKIHLFLTHEHYDHSHGVCWWQEQIETLLYCHRDCKGQLSTKKKSNPRLVAFVLAQKDRKSGGHQYDDFRQQVREYSLEPNTLLDDLQKLCVAGHLITSYHVPGHSPGSCCYLLDEQILFSGDTLIAGNKIITAFKGGSVEDMITCTISKLKALSDDLWVLPGHGEPFKKKDFNFDIYNV